MDKHPVHLLMVEDDDDDVFLIRDMLREAYQLLVEPERATTLAEAERCLSLNTYDLVLLDLSLPDSQGLDTFARIVAAAPLVPVVVISELDDEILAIKAVKDGAQDYLVKGNIDSHFLSHAIQYAIERKRFEQALRQSERRYRELLNAVPSYTYSVQIEHGVPVSTIHSPGCAAVTGYTPEEYARCPDLWISMVHPEDRPEVLRQINHDDSAENTSAIEHRIRHKDGRQRWVRSTIVRHFENGRVTRYEGLIEDITERKEAEEALRAAHDHLETRVSERTADLARANDELRAAIERIKAHDQAQSRFVSNVSHELRTPLSSMSYAIENLLRGVMGPVPERMGSYLVMLKDDCLRLRNTVNDILDLSRLDNERLTISRSTVLLPRLVERVVESLRRSAESKDHTLRLVTDGPPHFVSCDPTRLERVFLNIVQNAIKYTPDGGHIDIVMHEPDGNTGQTMVDVIDNGTGIESKHLHRIAERYYRIGEHVDGTGLGLYISREILTHHGGNLEFKSPPPGRQQGTQVTVVLPTETPPCVMIIDDDDSNRIAITETLRAHGYRVTATAQGTDALQVMRDLRPGAVLLDILLPDEGGTEILFCMKADPALRTVPVLGLTNRALDTAKHSILSGFSVSLLRCPWSDESLLAAIENVFRQAVHVEEVHVT